MIPRSKDGTYIVDPPGGSGPGSISILDEGILVGAFTKINFIGSSVTAVNAGGGQTDVTIQAYNTVEEEGGALAQRSTINFVGAGVTAADAGGKTVVTIPGVTGTDSCELEWGAGSILVTTTTRYLFPTGTSGGSGGNAPVNPIQIRIFKAGTLKNLRIRHRTTGGNANIVTYTVRINNVATTIAASIAANAAGLNTQDLVNTAAVAAGDLVDIRVTKAANIATSPNDITATLEWSL